MPIIPSRISTDDELFVKLSRAPIKQVLHQHNLTWVVTRYANISRHAIREKLMRANPWWKGGVNKPTIECKSSLVNTPTKMAAINDRLSGSGWDIDSIKEHVANIIYTDELAMWLYRRDHIRVVYMGAANTVIYSIGVILPLAGLSAAILFGMFAIFIATTMLSYIDYYPPDLSTRPICHLRLITDV